jgi:precorrin-6A/cobalt-precorrin-6A reductase
MSNKKLLILGGTGEAADLARKATDFFGKNLEIVISYAGVTGHQPDLPCEVRVGGFGGVEGLVRYLEENQITHVIDATHPFAEKMSQHVYIATRKLNLPVLVLWRDEWVAQPKDKWLEVASVEEAAEHVERLGGRVFLTTGIKDLAAFEGIETASFVVRLVNEPKEKLDLVNHELVISRPPYDLAAEKQLMIDHDIKLLVTKNSGGLATRAKIEAARELGIAVIMVQRPPKEPLEYVNGVAQAMQWISAHGI